MSDNEDFGHDNLPIMTPAQFREFTDRHMQAHAEAEEKAEQQRQARMMQKHDFLARQTPEDLILLRRLFRAAGDDGQTAAYLVGEINGILTYVHKVDLETGEDPFEQLLSPDVAPKAEPE